MLYRTVDNVLVVQTQLLHTGNMGDLMRVMLKEQEDPGVTKFTQQADEKPGTIIAAVGVSKSNHCKSLFSLSGFYSSGRLMET